MASAQKLRNRKMRIGKFGSGFVENSGLTLSSDASKIHFPSSKSLPYVTYKASLLPAVTASHLIGWQQSSPQWARRLNGWGPETLEPPPTTENWTTASPNNSMDGTKWTTLRPVPTTIVVFLLKSAYANAASSPAAKTYADIIFPANTLTPPVTTQPFPSTMSAYT